MEERHEIRWGGFAGLAFAVTAVVGYFAAGQPPRVDDSTAQIAGYFADNQNQVLAQTLLSCVAAVCLVAFASALAQVLRDRMPGSDVPWVVVTGIVMVAGLVFVGANLFGALAFLAASGETMTTVFVIGPLLFTTIGIASALPLIAVAVGIAATEVLPRWTAWFAGLCAALGVVGSFGIFTQDGALAAGGPVMSMVPFLASTAWVVIASGYMVREHLPSLSSVPQAMGHA